MTAQAREFRVTWQRQGMSRPNVRIFQTERAARRLVDKLAGKVFETPERRADDPFCCDGHGCNCGGMTLAERVAHDHARVPPMLTGYPVIDSRPVGAWEHVEVAPPDPRLPWPADEHGGVIDPVTVARALVRPMYVGFGLTYSDEEVPF